MCTDYNENKRIQSKLHMYFETSNFMDPNSLELIIYDNITNNNSIVRRPDTIRIAIYEDSSVRESKEERVMREE